MFQWLFLKNLIKKMGRLISNWEYEQAVLFYNNGKTVDETAAHLKTS